jgi:hypothetical protein
LVPVLDPEAANPLPAGIDYPPPAAAGGAMRVLAAAQTRWFPWLMLSFLPIGHKTTVLKQVDPVWPTARRCNQAL